MSGSPPAGAPKPEREISLVLECDFEGRRGRGLAPLGPRLRPELIGLVSSELLLLLMASNPAPRLLFCSSTLIGALSWTLTAVMVLDLKKALGGVSVTSTVEIAVFTTWATSLGTSLSLVLELVSSGAPRDAVSRLGPAASEAPSLVCLYLLYMMLQGCALLFVSATVATLDSSASMVVFTAVLVRAYVCLLYTSPSPRD